MTHCDICHTIVPLTDAIATLALVAALVLLTDWRRP